MIRNKVAPIPIAQQGLLLLARNIECFKFPTIAPTIIATPRMEPKICPILSQFSVSFFFLLPCREFLNFSSPIKSNFCGFAGRVRGHRREHEHFDKESARKNECGRRDSRRSVIPANTPNQSNVQKHSSDTSKECCEQFQTNDGSRTRRPCNCNGIGSIKS